MGFRRAPLASASAAFATLAFAALTLGAVPKMAYAQDEANIGTARELGLEGQKALDAKDFKTAQDRFERADALYQAPTLVLGLARAYAGQQKFVAAKETYNRVLRFTMPANPSPAFKAAVESAKSEIDAVASKVASVTISVNGPPKKGAGAPSVTLDDAPVPVAALDFKRPVDPGKHIVKATAPGFKSGESAFEVGPGGAAISMLTLDKDTGAPVAATTATQPTTPSNPATSTTPPPTTEATAPSGNGMKTAGFVALGVGAAGIIGGTVTGLLAMGKHGDLADKCPGGTCPSSEVDAVNSFKTMGTLSTVFFIVGGVGAATGTVLLVLSPKSESTQSAGAHISPYIGVGNVGAVGTF